MDGSQPIASLCVLASGSAGNCSVLSVGEPPMQRHFLIDAGLSPRRTRRLLADLGLGLEQVEAFVLTHLDHDHWHAGWIKALPAGASLLAHTRHAARGRRTNQVPSRVQGFDSAIDLGGGLLLSTVLGSHDELGVASFRFSFSTACTGIPARACLGFATDVGRMRLDLVEHLRGVDVLAIESNYCPRMQVASQRPWFLKRRIMGGSGHLSNDETLDAIRQIVPRSHVVLLHLSQECNDPALVAGLHAGAPYACTITSQTERTPWVPIHALPASRERSADPALSDPLAPSAAQAPSVQMALFSAGHHHARRGVGAT